MRWLQVHTAQSWLCGTQVEDTEEGKTHRIVAGQSITKVESILKVCHYQTGRTYNVPFQILKIIIKGKQDSPRGDNQQSSSKRQRIYISLRHYLFLIIIINNEGVVLLPGNIYLTFITGHTPTDGQNMPNFLLYLIHVCWLKDHYNLT